MEFPSLGKRSYPLLTWIDLSTTAFYLGQGQTIGMSDLCSSLCGLQHIVVGFSSYSSLTKPCKNICVFPALETLVAVTSWRHGCPRNVTAQNLRRLAYLVDEKLPNLDAAALDIQHLKSKIEKFLSHKSRKLDRKMPVVKIIISDII